MKSSYILDVSGLAFDETNGVEASWVHALPIGSYKHPIYGTLEISSDRAKNFADGVKAKVRGIDPSINYNHDNKDVAAGWVKDAEARVDGLWLFVEWVKSAAEKIKNKEWRYFSSEFEDEWEDPQGKKHKDVILGGALTNRPFMKNLVPINLSESTIELAFDLVAELTNTDKDKLKGGNTGMPLSEDDVKAIVEGLATKLTPAPPTATPPAEPQVSLMDIPELKELAEQNPMVALLVKQVEKQNADIARSATELKEAEIARKLSEFDRSKIVLTPTARELAAKLATGIPTELSEDFWKLLTEMKRGSSFMVELGERAGATVNYGIAKTADKQFADLQRTLKETHKLSDADAYERAAAENPALYARYRKELMEGATN